MDSVTFDIISDSKEEKKIDIFLEVDQKHQLTKALLL